MQTELEKLVSLYRELGIDRQIDYDKFYLYSLITHSTAIEGSTITELENQIMFDQGISLKGKSIVEQHMNLDLKDAYEHAIRLADAHTDITVDLLKSLSALVLKNTGQEYKTVLGDFSSARGDLRLLNVTAGPGGKSYMNYSKVPAKLSEFCTRLNRERENHAAKSMTQLYEISFDAHRFLVFVRNDRKNKSFKTNIPMNNSKKITWKQILHAIIQAAIAALTALGVTSCTTLF